MVENYSKLVLVGFLNRLLIKELHSINNRYILVSIDKINNILLY